ncbi:MAG: hypothetical protein ABFD25_17565 [Clostridiaceae bacterium]
MDITVINDEDQTNYACEKMILLKKIQILEAENKQLLQEYNMYKQAYERWACNKLILLIKRLLRR